MGYTTEFEGAFKLSKLPSAELILLLNALSEEESEKPPGHPRGYCDWKITKKFDGIEWNGAEKFYQYVEWLQYIIDEILKPAGITLSGSVDFKGEVMKDRGKLEIIDGKVVKKTSDILSTEVNELKAFRLFIMDHDDSDEILRKWEDERDHFLKQVK